MAIREVIAAISQQQPVVKIGRLLRRVAAGFWVAHTSSSAARVQSRMSQVEARDTADRP